LLCSIAGDVVVTSNLTVTITAHDKSNGVFSFVPPFSKSAFEGDTVSFQYVFKLSMYSVYFDVRTGEVKQIKIMRIFSCSCACIWPIVVFFAKLWT